jgi:transcriptional regulator GlxA family with amidase domain
MEENYHTLISLSDLGNRVNVTREHLCRVFKQEMGQTIIQYLQNLRISRARIFLLQYPEKRVVEIAQMCGFENPSYFGKIFKEEVGMTPDHFRKYRL